MEEDQEDNKTPVCRVCLNHIGDTEKCFYLFQKYDDIMSPDHEQDNVTIAFKIVAITKVVIIEGDDLPNKICSSCFLQLEDAYKFKRKCEKSDDILRIAKRYDSISHEQDLVKKEGDEFEHDYFDEDEIMCELHQSDESKSEDTLIDVKSENVISQSENNNLHKNSFSLPELQQKDCLKLRCDNAIDKIKVESKNIQSAYKDTQTSEAEANKNNQVKMSKAVDLKLECHDCGNLFKSKCKMRVHWKKEHKTLLTCPSCKLQFKSNKGFQNHKKFKTKSCLSASKMCIEGEGKTQVFTCKECDYSSKSRDNVVNHLIVHSNERPFSCDLCTKSFARAPSLKYHKERVHKQHLKQTTCHVCGMLVLGSCKFRDHMKKHRKKQVQCDMCKKFLSCKDSLIIHIRRHNGLKYYSCKICDRKFYSPSELCNHRKAKHEAKKFLVCKICGLKLRNRATMKQHEKKHYSNRLACGMCGFFFENETQLSLHLQRHMNRPHSCDYCTKTFYKRKSLTSHLRATHNVFISKGYDKIEKAKKSDKLK